MIAVIGGTGKLGRGLVARLAKSGEKVIIGSRTPKKAERTASELSEKTNAEILGAGNEEATRKSEIIFLSVPYKGINGILDQINPALNSSKIVVSTIVPLSFKEGEVNLINPGSESAAEEIASNLPNDIPVVSAFQTVSANSMRDIENPLNSDIPICGDNEDAKTKVGELINKLSGTNPIDVGPLSNSNLIESLGVLLVDLSLRHKSKGAGVRFEGI
ncbi:MAG: NADPH-dependent F420 reductase [Hadesarchaea archaeon]|nr:NADPH-dependent F420 reductase [Hadesarchaea archaeon]